MNSLQEQEMKCVIWIKSALKKALLLVLKLKLQGLVKTLALSIT